ncbi:hypothetical protein [Actinomadura violacea]|uniref:Uncharacterized protein n=1 Tax=Actinomadura violacea TaxID=2819934 RepID=A0ABS3RZ36_9ACTN|nr:hypothetical protein [Actinomadura violacea]MBO2461558.1 hypothetical protein [Actinomadura violacea]
MTPHATMRPILIRPDRTTVRPGEASNAMCRSTSAVYRARLALRAPNSRNGARWSRSTNDQKPQ